MVPLSPLPEPNTDRLRKGKEQTENNEIFKLLGQVEDKEVTDARLLIAQTQAQTKAKKRTEDKTKSVATSNKGFIGGKRRAAGFQPADLVFFDQGAPDQFFGTDDDEGLGDFDYSREEFQY